MSFLDTEPADIDQVDYVGPWGRFRDDDRRRCLAALNEVCRTDVPATLGTGISNGPTLKASLWSVDEGGGRLTFSVDPALTAAAPLAGLPQIWAAMYLGDVKLQFALTGLVLSRTNQLKKIGTAAMRMLQAEMPTHMYCMPRRRELRMRHGGRQGPVLRFLHPLPTAGRMCLPLLDISATGCAVQQPSGAPWLLAGTEIQQVEVELDDENFLFSDITVQHVTVKGADGQRHARVGCRWHSLSPGTRDRLERWLLSGRRSRDLLTLNFD